MKRIILTLGVLGTMMGCAANTGEPAPPEEVEYAMEQLGLSACPCPEPIEPIECVDGCCYQGGNLVGCYY